METLETGAIKGVVETEKETGQDEVECYGKEPDFHICFKLPRIIFKSIITEPKAGLIRQLAIATMRRYFYLTEDWKLKLSSIRYRELDGEIIIPQKVDGQLFKFDGASIPLPWLVSLLTIGILRPLGVLLIASIVHDFAFRHGYLQVQKQDGTIENVPVERGVADRLFKDIITVVNGNSIVGFLGWYFVRLGFWFRVPYNGEQWGGKKLIPVLISFISFENKELSTVLASFLAILTFLAYCWQTYSFARVAFGFLALYVSFYVLTLNRLNILSAKTSFFIILAILLFYLIYLFNPMLYQMFVRV